jgi:LytS/YehU family sensor histidine kinase
MLDKVKEKIILWYVRKKTEEYVRKNMDKFKGLLGTVVVGVVIAGVQAGIQVYSSGQTDIAVIAGAVVSGAVAYWMRSPKDKK